MTQLTPAPRLTESSPPDRAFLKDVIVGLSGASKRLNSKYFYDERGSRLFDAICDLDEYYLTRTELDIMNSHAAEMAAALGTGIALIEFGSGSSTKTRLLLEHLDMPQAYVPIDISPEHLHRSAAILAARFPNLAVHPLHADFSKTFQLPTPVGESAKRVVYFPGSTIGNFAPVDTRKLLQRIAGLIGPGGGLLIGIDLQKDEHVIENAYNDKRGITAKFNLNLLARINRELHANFKLNQFAHRAFYNPLEQRIEMHLESLQEQIVTVGEQSFYFQPRETICTEYSYKYSLEGFAEHGQSAGLKLARTWTDIRRWFAVLLFQAVSNE